MRTVVCSLLLLFSLPTHAQTSVETSTSGGLGSSIGAERTFGLGLVIGQPTALSGKLFFTSELAVTVLVGGWLHPHKGPVAGADLTFHVRDLVPDLTPLELGLYFGGGAGLGSWVRDKYHKHDEPFTHWHSHDVYEPLVYVRPVVGAAIWLRGVPLEVSVDIAPAIRLLPGKIELDLGGGLSVRYFF
ncbi:hypothetical protein ACFL6C_07310 [Myxococcota bacterium]